MVIRQSDINTKCRKFGRILKRPHRFLSQLSWKLKCAFLIARLSVHLMWIFHIFILVSKTTGPMSTKFDTDHPWVKGIHTFKMKGHGIITKHQNTWTKLKTTFSITTEPISTKLGTKHPWVEGIQVCSNEGPRLLPRGYNYEIAKLYGRNLAFFFFRTTWTITTKLGKVFLVKGIQVY